MNEGERPDKSKFEEQRQERRRARARWEAFFADEAETSPTRSARPSSGRESGELVPAFE